MYGPEGWGAPTLQRVTVRSRKAGRLPGKGMGLDACQEGAVARKCQQLADQRLTWKAIEGVEAEAGVFRHDCTADFLGSKPALLFRNVLGPSLQRPGASPRAAAHYAQLLVFLPGRQELTWSSGRSSFTDSTVNGSSWPLARMATT